MKGPEETMIYFIKIQSENTHDFFFYKNYINQPQPQILKKNTQNEPKIFLSDSYYHFFHIQSQ